MLEALNNTYSYHDFISECLRHLFCFHKHVHFTELKRSLSKQRPNDTGVPTFHRSQASSTHTITRAEHQHQSIGSSHDCHASETETATAGAMTRNSVLKHLGVGVAGVLSAAALGGGSVPALADNALIATKQSYFRYVPRILVRSDVNLKATKYGCLQTSTCGTSRVALYSFTLNLAAEVINSRSWT